jgi:hypothetical protein
MDLNELSNNPEQIKQLISLLQALLPKNNSEEAEEPEEFVSPIRTKSSRQFHKQNSEKNKFLDMPEKDMFKEDSRIDKMLNKHPPVSRTRQFSTIEVVCRVCGRKETISPGLAGESPKRYKCNNCSTSPG